MNDYQIKRWAGLDSTANRKDETMPIVKVSENELSEITEHWPEGAELVQRIYAALAERDILRGILAEMTLRYSHLEISYAAETGIKYDSRNGTIERARKHLAETR